MIGPWASEWIDKAEQDWSVATACDPEVVPDPVAFHCQQLAEKYLKALLAHSGAEIERTHDLDRLRRQLVSRHPALDSIAEDIVLLNAYSVAGRYPGHAASPDEARSALEVATRVRRRIRELLDLEEC